MAHECPECGLLCHCHGDIDDICFSGTKAEMLCDHCPFHDEEEPEEYFEVPPPMTSGDTRK